MSITERAEGDALFDTVAPQVSMQGAAAICRDVFGIDGAVTPLPSERDRNFMVRTPDQAVVLKISHPAEDRGVVEMENAAMLHVAGTDPGLPIPRVIPTVDGRPITTTVGDDGRSHLTRLISVLPGQDAEGRFVSTALAGAIGDVSARLSIALRGFFHPAAGRTHVWDIREVASLAPHLDAVPDAESAQLVRRALSDIAPTLSGVRLLPAQVEHADVTLTNVLTRGDELLGVIDFGDMHHTASACDLAASLTSVLRSVVAEGPDAVVATASAYLEGYQRRRPLAVEEAAALGDLVRARLVATVLISAWRARLHPDNTAYISQYDDSSWALLRCLADDLDASATLARLSGTSRVLPAQQPDPTLARRRREAMGGRLAPLFYRQPLHMVRASGAYMYDAAGRAYLDAYNNVPVLGHEHPAVVQAVAAQMRALNTNSRYLHANSVELAERLIATMPPGLGLDTCVFVNSGTEAVDLAWRMATAATGGSGALVVEHGYHGMSATVVDFSTNEWPPGHDPQHVATFRAPHRLADGSPATAAGARDGVERAVARLSERGHRPALLLMDPMFTSEGILEPGPEVLPALGAAARAGGALVLADEVQSGFGRTGPGLWSFARAGLRPDIVTLGKPMGNGFPVAAVLTRSDVAASLSVDREYFSTFAGSPVAAAAALTVLDVLQDNRIPESAVRVGDYLRAQLRAVAEECPILGEVRGVGLVAGVDVVGADVVGADVVRADVVGADVVGAGVVGADPVSGRELAGRVVEVLRDHGVLVGATGPGGNVLKVRPPLIWQEDHVDELVTALRSTLAALD